MKTMKAIEIVAAKKSAHDAIKKLDKLSKDAISCNDKSGETIAAHIEQFHVFSRSNINLALSCR